MKYYFTCDYHLDHYNIIKYTGRPFDNIEEMNQTIIENHNKIVKPKDTVFFLGDFSFGTRNKFLDKFNGKFTFIKGNHDKKPIIDSVQINYGGMDINLTHYPQNIKKEYDINLVGHVHEKWRIKEYSNTILINVGVDQWDFKPVSIGDIHKVINKNNLRGKLQRR